MKLQSSKLFIDTSYIIGLYNNKDENHQICLDGYEKAKLYQQFYTTDAILLEIGNTFCSVPFRKEASSIIQNIKVSSNIHVVALTEEYFEKTFDLYKKIADKSWGLIDCFSFVVMNDFKITKALTLDHHFKQAGFTILPF